MFTAITKNGPAFEPVPTREWAALRARAEGMTHDHLVTDPDAPLEGRAWRIEEVEGGGESGGGEEEATTRTHYHGKTTTTTSKRKHR